MPIPQKKDNESVQVKINLCGEAKKIVKAKQKELKEAGLPYGKNIVIIQLILENEEKRQR